MSDSEDRNLKLTGGVNTCEHTHPQINKWMNIDDELFIFLYMWNIYIYNVCSKCLNASSLENATYVVEKILKDLFVQIE